MDYDFSLLSFQKLHNNRSNLDNDFLNILRTKSQAIERLTGSQLTTDLIFQKDRIVGLNVREELLPKILYSLIHLEIFYFQDVQIIDQMKNLLEQSSIEYLYLVNVKNLHDLKGIKVKYIEITHNTDVSQAEEEAILDLITNAVDYKIHINGYKPKLDSYNGISDIDMTHPNWNRLKRFFSRETRKLEDLVGKTLNNEPKYGIAGCGNQSSENNYYRYQKSYKITRIGLPHANLNSFPEVLLEFPDLEYLDLSHNNFTSIPEEVFEFKSLKKLYMSHNKLSNLNKRLQELPLTTLVLSHNKINYIPKYIGEMASLQYIDLSHNKISQTPTLFFNTTSASYIFLEGQAIPVTSKEISAINANRSQATIFRLDVDGNDQHWSELDGGIVVNPMNSSTNRK